NDIELNIQSRRNELLESGMSYYHSLAKVVDIPLSAKNEFIYVRTLLQGMVEVEVRNKKKDGSEGRRLYKRNFYPEETEELRIYGIAGEDEYILSGDQKSNIKIRIIGGSKDNKYANRANIPKQNRNFHEETQYTNTNAVALNNKVKYRLKNDYAEHAYDYYNYKYDRKGAFVNLNYGVDRGLIIGLGYLIENQGFRKAPFA